MGHVSEKFMAKEESTAFPAVRSSQTCPTAPPKSPPRLRCSKAPVRTWLPCCPRKASHRSADNRPASTLTGSSLNQDSIQSRPPRHRQGRTHQQPRDSYRLITLTPSPVPAPAGPCVSPQPPLSPPCSAPARHGPATESTSTNRTNPGRLTLHLPRRDRSPDTAAISYIWRPRLI